MIVPDYLKKGRIALKAGMSELELRQRLKNGLSVRDKKKLIQVYKEIIQELEGKIKELTG
jgi:hypothetical protein